MKRYLKLLIAVVCLAATTLVIAPAGAQRGEPETDAPSFAVSPDEWATLSSAAGDGTVRVIVGLDTPTEPEGTLSAAAAADQRSAIASAREELYATLSSGSASVVREYETLPFVVVEADQTALDELAVSAQVTSVQEDVLSPPLLQSSLPIVQAPGAWSAGFTGDGKAIAILDTGVAKNHPLLAGKVVSEACYSVFGNCPGGNTSTTANNAGLPCTYSTLDCPHGTHVAGIAAGNNGPAAAPSGVAKDADLIAINVFSNAGGSPVRAGSATSDQIAGLDRVFQLRNSFDIAAVNMSLGGGAFSTFCDGSQAATKAAIDQLRSVGIATVIATGNDGMTTQISAPACISTAVSVGSTTDADQISNFSNQSFQVNLVAPGSSINSSVPLTLSPLTYGYSIFNGTSMATPHVAGAFAILDEKAPKDTVGRKLSILQERGTLVTDVTSLKFSRINIQSSINWMPGPYPNPGFPDVPTNHPFYKEIAWAADEDITGGYSDGTFRPGDPVSRQALAVFLWRLDGEPAGPFPDAGYSDVPAGPFRTAIWWAAYKEITQGFPDGTFKPSNPISRQATAAFLYRFEPNLIRP
jgi:subtilisin family serine protease